MLSCMKDNMKESGEKDRDPTTAVLMLYTGITWTPPNSAHEPHFVVETAFSLGELLYFTLLLSGFLFFLFLFCQSIKGKQGGIKTFPICAIYAFKCEYEIRILEAPFSAQKNLRDTHPSISPPHRWCRHP